MRLIRKFNEGSQDIIKSYENNINKLKESFVQEIINAPDISKQEKLKIISKNKLFQIDSYICAPFEDRYLQEYLDIVEESPEFKDKNRPISSILTDDYFHKQDYQRHQVVDLSDVVEYYEDDINLDPSMRERSIVIYTNRTTRHQFKISAGEFINTIYDWCIKNKIIGFEIDW